VFQKSRPVNKHLAEGIYSSPLEGLPSMEIIYDEKQQKWRFIVSEFSPIGYLIDKALPATCELPFEIRGGTQ